MKDLFTKVWTGKPARAGEQTNRRNPRKAEEWNGTQRETLLLRRKGGARRPRGEKQGMETWRPPPLPRLQHLTEPPTGQNLAQGKADYGDCPEMQPPKTQNIYFIGEETRPPSR